MERSVVISAEQLKAMGHPLRVLLLENLGYRGPMTASALAELVEESPSNCSWHLRRLADAGLVERAVTDSGRDKPWQLAFDNYEFDGAIPESNLPEIMSQRRTTRMVRAMEHQHEQAKMSTASAAWLTQEEAQAVIAKLHEAQQLAMSNDERRTDPTARPEGTQLYEFVGWVVPVSDLS